MHELAQRRNESEKLGPTSKVTIALGKKVSSLHARLRSTLEEMYAWMAAASDDPHADVRYPQHVIDGMLRKDPDPAPWHAGSQSSGVRLMLGRRFFMAESDLHRCQEHLLVLPIEKRRLMQWLEIMSARIDEHLSAIEGELPLGPNEPWHLIKQHGVQFWLRWHARRLAALTAEGRKQFRL